MGIRETLISELRLLRRAPGPLDDAKLTLSKAILKGLGGGDASLALARLERVRQLNESDRDVSAAFASFGYDSVGDSVLARLEEFAALNFVDARTARRWSDAGIAKLAGLIVSADPWRQPVAALNLLAYSTETQLLDVRLRLRGQPNVAMFEPKVEIDREAVPIAWMPRQPGLTVESEAIAVHLEEEVAVLSFQWRGDLACQYSISIPPRFPLSVSFRPILNKGEIRLERRSAE